MELLFTPIKKAPLSEILLYVKTGSIIPFDYDEEDPKTFLIGKRKGIFPDM